jgi:hypothetical protein
MTFVRVPPDSTGKKVHTRQNTVGTDVVQTQIVHIADKNFPDNLQAIDIQGAASVRFAEGQPILSGFGSLKTTHERVLGVYESSLDTYESLFSTITTLGGQTVYQPQASSQVLSVDGVNTSAVRLITNRYHYYTPGSSNLYKLTVACGDVGKPNNIRRWGAADTNDGLFFELNGTTLKVVVRSSVTGGVIDDSINQSNWNKDKLDGTGQSGFNINITNVNVYWLDYQWLGGGRVRFGVYTPDGSRIVAHQFEHAGQLNLPYMRTGTLPAFLENLNTGTTGSTSELRNVCIGVYTEGTYEDYAFWRFADIDKSGLNTTIDSHICSVRAVSTVNAKHNTVIIYPETLNIYCTDAVAITMYQSTDVVGGTWSTLSSAGEVNYTGVPNLSGSQKFKTLYFGPGAHSTCIDQYFEKNDEGIQMNADGTYENWSFLATRLTANATSVTMNLGYKELW